MIQKYFVLHIIILFFDFTTVNAQNASVFETITTANGLPSNYVFCVEEDKEGFMWVGTDKGLCRFNGTVWEVWDIDNGLPGNYVNKILSDKHNGLWLGLAEKGMFHFDLTTKKSTLVFYSKSLQVTTINTNGDLLVNETDTAKHKITKWVYRYTNPTNQKKINEFTYENDNTLYEDSVSKLTHYFQYKNQKLNPRNATTKNSVTHNLTKINIDFANYNIAKTPEFLINNNWVLRFNNNPAKDTLLLLKDAITVPGYIAYCDTKEILYFASPNAGFYCIEKETNAITHYTENDGLTNLNINHIFKDKHGTLFISTLGGGINVLKKYPLNHFVTKQLPLRNLQVSKDKYYGLANGTLYQFDYNAISAEIFLRKDALSFYITNDTLLVGSFEGLHYYSFKNNKAVLQKTIPLTAGISSIVPFNNKWLYGTYGNGFYTTVNFITAEKTFNTLPFGNIENTVVLKNTVAALSFEDGFFICDKNLSVVKHYTTKDGLLSNYVSTIFEQKDTLWVGGKGGVSLIANGKVFKTLSYQQGFKGKMVKHIFSAVPNRIQIVSDKYIHHILNGVLYAYGSNSLILNKNDFIIEALFDSNNQRVIVSTQSNIGIAPFATILPIDYVFNAGLLSVQIDNRLLSSINNFEVNYNSDNIVFQFKPTGNLLFSQNQLLYKLNDNDWQVATDNLVVSFKKLRSGRYTLFTKTINADGFESKPQPIISFTVNRPWWLQWWFIGLLVTVVFLFLWQLSKYLNKRKYLTKLKQQKELETERQRISRDLHDNMGAYTSALIANVQQLKNKTGDNTDLQKMQTNAEQILNSLRETIWVLNNKEITLQEFSDGFKNYCFKLLKNFEHISFDAEENITENYMLPASKSIHLNKIMQEVIQNIIKHANATVIKYEFNTQNGLHIQITDNGSGFNNSTESKGYGLDNMKWRAKEAGVEIDIQSQSNKGCSITIKNTPK